MFRNIYFWTITCTLIITGGISYIAYWGEQRQLENKELKRKNDIILKGRADKENGLKFTTNPYLTPEDRELWRHGWRNAREVKE